jgi:hypothetical protein
MRNKVSLDGTFVFNDQSKRRTKRSVLILGDDTASRPKGLVDDHQVISQWGLFKQAEMKNKRIKLRRPPIQPIPKDMVIAVSNDVTIRCEREHRLSHTPHTALDGTVGVEPPRRGQRVGFFPGEVQDTRPNPRKVCVVIRARSSSKRTGA